MRPSLAAQPDAATRMWPSGEPTPLQVLQESLGDGADLNLAPVGGELAADLAAVVSGIAAEVLVALAAAQGVVVAIQEW